MSRVEYIDNGSGNLVSVSLYSDGTPIDLSSAGVTRVQIEIDDDAGTVLDSNVIASMRWDQSLVIDGETVYPIQFAGSDAGLPAGVYRDCRVRVFDNVNTNGVLWPDPLTFIVR